MRPHYTGKLLFSLGFIIIFNSSLGQNIEELGKENPVKITGGISANAEHYYAEGIQNRRPPFFWLLNANLNFKIYGVDVPFSATISQQNQSYTQPFNQYGISPTYKDWTAHLGYRSMFFSSYTLSGIVFLGGGIEYQPSDRLVKFSLLYGRFARAVEGTDSTGIYIGRQSYDRWGYGGKLTLGDQSNSVDIILFHARDDINSLKAPSDQITVDPAENIVFGISTKQRISNRFTFSGELAHSGYTTDQRVTETDFKSYSYANNLGPLFNANTSSQFNNALKGDLSYTGDRFNLQLRYQRIGPEYKTMGAIFLNNDLEELALNGSWQMFKNKVAISTSLGGQRDNLSNNEGESMSRLAGAISLNYFINKNWNFSAGYNSFSTSTKMRIYEDPDSLLFLQLTQNSNVSIGYNKQTGNLLHAVFVSGNYQTADDNSSEGMKFYNGNASYSLTISKLELSFSTAYLYSITRAMDVENLYQGPSATLSKGFFKGKLNLSFNTSFTTNYLNGTLSGKILNTRLNAGYSLKAKHTFSLHSDYLMREALDNNTGTYSEIRAGISYGYIF